MTGDTHLQYITGGNLAAALTESVTVTGADRLFVLTDTNTSHLCLPLLQGATPIDRATEITIAAGDINKTIASLQHVWQTLSNAGATRRFHQPSHHTPVNGRCIDRGQDRHKLQRAEK